MTGLLLSLLLLAPSGLVEQGVRWSATQDPITLSASLRAAVLEKSPEQDPAGTVALLLVRVGAARLADEPEAAIPLLVRGHGQVVRLFDQAHPARLAATSAVAAALRTHGRAEDAEPLYRALLAQHQRTLGATHPRTLAVRSDLGDTLARLEQTPAAVATLEAARGDAAQAPAPLRAQIAARLGQTYGLEQPQRAYARFTETMAHWGPHPGSLEDGLSFADFLVRARHPNRAVQVLLELSQHTTSERPLVALATVYFDQGRYQRAAQVAQRALPNANNPTAALGWLYRLASAEGAAGHHQAAHAWITQARALAKANRGAYAQWGRPFDALRGRLELAEQTQAEARALPVAPIAIRAPSGAVERQLSALLERAAERGVDPHPLDTDPALSAVRQDPRWHGVRRWLAQVERHWKIHTPVTQAGAAPTKGPWLVILPDDGDTPVGALAAVRAEGWAGPALAVSPTWALGPAAFRWSHTAADAAHLARHLDRLEAPERVYLVGLGAAAALAQRIASEDPDRYAGAASWGPASTTAAHPPPLSRDQVFVARCATPPQPACATKLAAALRQLQ
jgi:tetratricopeptide (TPR) repeat protein